ncbi:heavy metal translocating P-type ATPase [Bacillus pseudomycoides]|uniref:Cd(2+)-exporting ATPase n=1 Tax=Bacillus pseudomycoides TaxID=64104 RepID=A0ABD6T768_9BACI|nr:cation-translocating P-type ATPase [Bacillus pseudomycoides]PEK39738.1 heavy metal translocating P-type ATPase [Bacillus pseudomycoides]PEO45071.1 heavy metal translocating P-type ATPase [Bacillus pseudomycoides]PEP38231.1 heavy metal translocating P-type ATPase [Bacillus pseudomycoides]PEP44731.1 heavy metal translocating P-type ATPase [Bacillus pseudomycoides]PEP84996.1 heavy metal translocating P-type ATPase [Bacillus pseudomycoides]
MTDKKEKQTSCCQTSSYSDSSLTPIKKEVTKEISSCCSSQNQSPIVLTVKKASCCSNSTDTAKTENDSSDSCCGPKPEKVSLCCSSFATPKEEVTPKASSCCSDSSCEDTLPRDTPKVTGDGVQTYLVGGMDCGACALTIEKHLQNVSGVQEVHVNFATGKMHIRHDRSADDIIKEISNAGFEASLAGSRRGATPNSKSKDTTLILSGLFLALGFFSGFANTSPLLITLLYAASTLIGGYKPAKSAFYALRSKALDMNVLMISAAIGAALIGQWLEGATVVWLFALGATLQNKSIERTRESIRGLIDLAPSEAWVKVETELVKTSVEDITVDTTIVVKPGEKIPLDGTVIGGNSTVNQAPITGESIPIDKQIGDSVYAGTINEEGSLEITVTKLVEDTTLSRIIHLVEEAQEKKAPTEAFVDRFAKIYTPIVFLLAISVMILPPLLGMGTWMDWIYRGLELLVVACPCALVISTPVAIVSAIGNAARNGVLIKGGTALEIAGSLNAIAFDKTGTLTEGKPQVMHVRSLDCPENELLSIATTIEEYSNHPIARAITTYAKEQQISVQEGKEFRAIVGKGAQVNINGETYYAGNAALFDDLGTSLQVWKEPIQEMQRIGQTVVLIGTNHTILGMISVADSIRSTTYQTIQELKRTGIRETVMLTGDNEGTANHIAQKAKVDRYFANLLPEDKVRSVKHLQSEGKTVAMIGDGINDAPALATANLGIAMGGAGTDTAMETADIVLMADNLEKLPYTMKLSRKALHIIKQNIWFSLIIKFIALAFIFPGWLTLWIAVLSDTGAALLVILNSMRLLQNK